MVKFKNFLLEQESIEEAKNPNDKLFKQMQTLASQINKYAHRWGDNPSQRMLGWVDTYNDNKEKMQQDGTWEEYCKLTGFSKGHNGYDCLA